MQTAATPAHAEGIRGLGIELLCGNQAGIWRNLIEMRGRDRVGKSRDDFLFARKQFPKKT